MDEEATASGNIDVKNLKVRSRNWIYARSIESSDGNLKFDKPEIQEVASRILKYAKDKEKGSFNPSRERDELSLGQGQGAHRSHQGAREKDDLEARIRRGQAHVQETWPRPGD